MANYRKTQLLFYFLNSITYAVRPYQICDKRNTYTYACHLRNRACERVWAWVCVSSLFAFHHKFWRVDNVAARQRDFERSQTDAIQ